MLDAPLASALFLSPEAPVAGSGGGGLRSASLLEYLRAHYAVEVVGIEVVRHSKSLPAKLWRNSVRLLRGVPPLFDRFSGYEDQLTARIAGRQFGPSNAANHFDIGVVEHFWCAGYAPLLRRYCSKLVLDLHNIESDLAETHARAAGWPSSWASRRFAESYRKLEREWISKFELVLVTCDEDAWRVEHPRVVVYPNALPEIARPQIDQENCIVFSGNLEYHPNMEAVRWFRSSIWPRLRERFPDLEWRLVGKNPEAVARWTSGDHRIKVIGPVADAIAEIARAKVAVVPLLSGSGTRFKILEAWAAERAVVSTTLGSAGLGGVDGEHLRIADAADAFAGAVAGLLDDPGKRVELGAAGRQLYLERFTWPAAWKRLEGHL